MKEYKNNKIAVCFGTRPEAIKLAPVVIELKKQQDISVNVIVTAQHREMLDQVLSLYEIEPDIDLNVMMPNQKLETLTAKILEQMSVHLKDIQPNVLIVQGDTTTTLASSLAAFYQGIPVAHVEAGLRTYNLLSPFPEEMNRRLTSCITRWHFAPTERAEQALLKENIPESMIHMVGNTVIDSLLYAVEKARQTDELIRSLFPVALDDKDIILVTGHRRENFGEGFLNICKALKKIGELYPEKMIVYPVHLNPNVQKPVKEILTGIDNVHLLAPLDYLTFIWLLDQSKLVMTDSGGIQEEAPALGKPVLVMRNTTERPEAIEAGVARLVGTETETIVNTAQLILDNTDEYTKMAVARNPFGDGKSAKRIVDILVN